MYLLILKYIYFRLKQILDVRWKYRVNPNSTGKNQNPNQNLSELEAINVNPTHRKKCLLDPITNHNEKN